MPTTFLLDPRVLVHALDERVNDSTPDVEVRAEGLGYLTVLGRKEFVFYLNPKEKQKLPERLTELAYQRQSRPRESIYFYPRALITAVRLDDGLNSMPQKGQDILEVFSVMYAQGKFLKGDAEKLKNYGVEIKP